MKQLLKKVFLRFRMGKNIWNYLTSRYHKIRRCWKHAIQKKRDFNKYVYPIVGRHPSKKDIFLVLSPTYRNLGDHAIAKAEIEWLADCGISLREISIDVVQVLARHNDYAVFGRSTILITGGGYFGTLWPHMHEMACRIIEDNLKAKVIIMPNTLYFDQTPVGEELFDISLDIFNLPNVKRIYLREKTSYNKIHDKCASAKLMPDVALYLNETRPDCHRKGCLICLRDDKEKTLSEAETVMIHNSAKQLFGSNVMTTDMRNNTDVPIAERAEKLEQKFEQFRQAELVITDRLHGMIFAAITGTPCIVMNSRSHKLIGCYEWIEHLDYIRFCNSAEAICRIYSDIPRREHFYNSDPLKPWFEEMKEEIIALSRE